jgi:tRNA nucleotidyltransferase (CCA-adding enzyme)
MDIIEIAHVIEQNGGRLYLVGGALRDSLLNRPIYDEDYCVIGIEKDKFIELFPKAISRGKSFEVFDLYGKEFALARTEKKIGKGHKNFEITTGKNITIEEDLKRRDITINSIAKDVLTNEMIDPFGGIEDIKNRIIRAVGDSFLEDPLRVYRVARFASELQFEVEEKTSEYMRKLRDELDTLSKERVFVEFRKALSSDRPSTFFNVLKEAKVLDIHFKEIYNLIGSLQPLKYHPEGDSYNHTMIAVDNSVRLTDDVLIRYACLVHDLGKGLTPEEEYPHHHGHATRGVEPVRNLSNRIGVPTSWKKAGVTSSKEHMRRW